MSSKSENLFQQLPSVDQLVNEAMSLPECAGFGRQVVTRCAREVIGRARAEIQRTIGTEKKLRMIQADMVRALVLRLQEMASLRMRRVINATGIILHTGLGRAPLSAFTIEALSKHASGYCELEIDPETGERRHREAYTGDLLCELTGAEAATVVNNNAAAVLLTLATIAKGKEVIISRGQIVEIGGSFRLHEVMALSGARLVEVGTTNRTYLSDYENAIGSNTAALMRVHRSNFAMQGFVESVDVRELVSLARRSGLVVVDDLGSGLMIDLSRFGVIGEPIAKESIATGVDIVTFSGDKLLGGPQCGIILGKRALIGAIRRNPLFRAVRPCKLTLVALEATLRSYLDEERALQDQPVLKFISRSLSEIKRDASALCRRLRAIPGVATAEVVPAFSQVGGGASPECKLPTRVVVLTFQSFNPGHVQTSLRKMKIPVYVRVADDKLLIDVRTVTRAEHEVIAIMLKEALEKVQVRHPD